MKLRIVDARNAKIKKPPQVAPTPIPTLVGKLRPATAAVEDEDGVEVDELVLLVGLVGDSDQGSLVMGVCSKEDAAAGAEIVELAATGAPTSVMDCIVEAAAEDDSQSSMAENATVPVRFNIRQTELEIRRLTTEFMFPLVQCLSVVHTRALCVRTLFDVPANTLELVSTCFWTVEGEYSIRL